MYQFFVEDAQLAGDIVTITEGDAIHMKNVLRMKPGDRIRVSTLSGRNYFCAVWEMGEAFVKAVIEKADESGTELLNRICLFQGLPKNDKMELIIQKAVELGVYEIIPVAMKHCVVKLDEKKAASKTARWQEIAKSAAKQSKRSLIPAVRHPMRFSEAVSYAAGLDVRLLPYENERGMSATKKALESIKEGESIGIFIGPEGGFAPEEIALAEQDMQLISLGKRILRTETAGLAALAILMYHLECRF